MVRGEPTFLPCTPLGIVEMLVRSGITIERSEVVVVGRGALVGMPLAIMLSQKAPNANATVTICHTGTKDLSLETRRADIPNPGEERLEDPPAGPAGAAGQHHVQADVKCVAPEDITDALAAHDHHLQSRLFRDRLQPGGAHLAR